MLGAWPSAPVPFLNSIQGYLEKKGKQSALKEQNILFRLQGAQGGGGGSWVLQGKLAVFIPACEFNKRSTHVRSGRYFRLPTGVH